MKDAEIFGRTSAGTPTPVLVDSSGNQPMVGDVAHDAADSGNPVKVGGVARQTNPTAVADGDRVNQSLDDLGREISWPFQVRDLLATAYATLTRGQETSVLAGVASTLQDVVTVSGANTSSVAQIVSIRTGTGGSIVDTIVIPPTDTVSKQYSVPLLQSEVAQAWTAQNVTGSDISDSPVTVTISAIKNI